MNTSSKETGDSYILEAEDLSKAFKGLIAVNGYHLKLRRGEILAIIGPNGAGKTTVFNLLTGHIRQTRGTIRFLDHDITQMPPDKIAALGIGRTFQNVRLFQSMTVLDNVKAAQQIHDPDNLLTTMLTWPSFLARERRLGEQSLEQLALFNLDGQADRPARERGPPSPRRVPVCQGRPPTGTARLRARAHAALPPRAGRVRNR